VDIYRSIDRGSEQFGFYFFKIPQYNLKEVVKRPKMKIW